MERIAVFEKTKMCKFHIMGVCAKGDGCRFAHERTQLQAQPDLSCTKLCKTLIATGACNDGGCCYAHNRQELRSMPEPPSGTTTTGLSGAAAGGVVAVPAHQGVVGSQTAVAANAVVPVLVQAAGAGPCGVIGLPMTTLGGGALPGQGAFVDAPPVVTHAAIAQIAQAAQAHAVEAARLQAMAATLQQDGFPLFALGAAAPVAPATSGGTACTAPPGQAPPPGHNGAVVAVQAVQPAWEAGVCQSGPGPQEIGGAAGYERQESCGSTSTAASTEPGGSSQSTTSADSSDEGGGPGAAPGRGGLIIGEQGLGGMRGVTIKNTFLDFDDDDAPSVGALRAVQTAGGRLDVMAPSLD